ncbi:MAG TPA: ribonuclease D [Gemmatimonadaceae bacterium]|nr:ribonuclease D [Gemmatimonadaceae bacterium]
MPHTPVFIDRPDTAARDLGALAGSAEIAVDTEGASFHRFVDRVYLLQLSTRDRTAIVDPLAVDGDALAPIRAMIESASVETVFHDADYDLRLLQQDYGWQARKLFDTRVAAQLLGLKAFGLAALLERYFGVKLDKKHQRADWSMRPLLPDMLDYAAQDTMYLLELRDILHGELKSKGRLDWAREEFVRLESIRWAEEEPGSAFLRIKGARDLSRRELAVLRELVPWRDGVAAELDRATFRVIGNEQLLEIARVQPRSIDDLGRIRGVPRGILERRGREILQAVQRGIEVPEAELPKFPRGQRWDRDPEFDTKVNALKTVRDQVSQDLDLDPGVLCARDRMEAVARKNPKSADELAEVTELRNWQREVLGPGFLKALAAIRR